MILFFSFLGERSLHSFFYFFFGLYIFFLDAISLLFEIPHTFIIRIGVTHFWPLYIDDWEWATLQAFLGYIRQRIAIFGPSFLEYFVDYKYIHELHKQILFC